MLLDVSPDVHPPDVSEDKPPELAAVEELSLMEHNDYCTKWLEGRRFLIAESGASF